MPSYLSPAVYVEEVSGGSKPIEGVGTSTAAFVGRAIKGPVNQAMLITNFTQFQATFGGFRDGYYLAYGVRNFYLEGGSRCYGVRVFKNSPATDPTDTRPDVARIVLKDAVGNDALRVWASSPGAWGNNISIEVGDPTFDPNDKLNTDQKFKLIVSYKESATAAPTPVETFDRLSLKEFATNGLRNLFHAETQINGVSQYISVDDLSPNPAIFAPPAKAGAQPLLLGKDGLDPIANDFIGDAATGNALYAFDKVDDINIVAIPDLASPGIDGGQRRDATVAALGYCQTRADCIYLADPPSGLTPQGVIAYKQGTSPFSGNGFNTSYGALYYPWIFITDPLTGKRLLFPPSASVAGIYASTDTHRGVHKAPAGTDSGHMNSAVDIERIVTKGEHDGLNPEGINVIRKFADAGIVVWGARTLSADPEGRYVNVRRLLMFLEKSIFKGTQWVVFEPNDSSLWSKIRRNVGAFLQIQWTEGMLVGDKPEQAFFVKCDEETNPADSVDLGRVITIIGIRPSKPAEFVIFRIMQTRPGEAG